MITKADVKKGTESYFPLLVAYVNDRTGEINSREVVKNPDELANGKTFRVLKTNYKEDESVEETV